MGPESRRVTRSGLRTVAPRGSQWTWVLVRSIALTLWLAAFSVHATAAQVTPPDTIPVVGAGVLAGDSLAADSLALDTLATDSSALDTLAVGAVPDSAAADSIFYNLPDFSGEVPASWSTGVWAWDLVEIHASGANTLTELVAEVPGVIVMLGGDYGTPAGLTAFGTGGGGFRVFRDGFELFPVDGGVVDLSRVGLGGIERVRLERGMGDLRIEMWSKSYEDGRPFSLVEAGTGDLATNLFRGTYADPTALGGSLGLALERTDTRGPGGDEAGGRTGSWVRYQLHRGDAAGLAIELHNVSTQTDLADYPSPAARTDWTVRGRAQFAAGLVGEAYTGKSTHTVDDIRDTYEREGGSRRQSGLRLGFDRNGVWARGEYRMFGGDELPANRLDLMGGFARPGIGGVAADLSRGSWVTTRTSASRVRAWTDPIGGVFSLFGSRESGGYGSRTLPLLDVEPAVDTTGAASAGDPGEAFDPGRLFGVSERTATRLGATLSWRGASVSGALLTVENDTLIPLGLGLDRAGPFVGGAERKGWEGWGALPMPMKGLRLQGSLQRWDIPGSYLPEQIYTGALVFHRLYLDSGNFEWWWTIGARGHSAMTLPILGEPDAEGEPQLQTVPFYQDWYARIQVRIVTIQIYVAWDNFTRRPKLQNYPGRILPRTRTVYGIRWTMRN